MKQPIIYDGSGSLKNAKHVRENSLRMKAWICLYFTIFIAGRGMSFYDDYGAWVYLPAAVSLILTLWLFIRETPMTTLEPGTDEDARPDTWVKPKDDAIGHN